MDNHNIRMTTPFFMVGDIRRSLEFYVDALGFRLTKSWEPDGKLTWCWLERESATLMLQEYRTDDARFQTNKGIGVAICFQCADALELYREFVAKSLKPKEPF